MLDSTHRLGATRPLLRAMMLGAAIWGLLGVSTPAAGDEPTAATGSDAVAQRNDGSATEPGLDRLRFMIGRWDVAAKDQTGELLFNTVSTIRPILDGKALEEEVIGYWGEQEWPMRLLRSYDKFQDKHRLVALDGLHGFLDIYEGTWNDGGLEESNVASGTYAEFEGKRYFYRSRVERQGTGFQIVTDASGDGGKSWQPAGSFHYTPAR